MEHTRNFNFFTIHITLKPHKYVHELNPAISVTNNVIYKTECKNYTTYKTKSPSDFLHQVILFYFSYKCSGIIAEKEIVFISDPKNITREHYLEQPKSMLCHKVIRSFLESTSQDVIVVPIIFINSLRKTF